MLIPSEAKDDRRLGKTIFGRCSVENTSSPTAAATQRTKQEWSTVKMRRWTRAKSSYHNNILPTTVLYTTTTPTTT